MIRLCAKQSGKLSYPNNSFQFTMASREEKRREEKRKKIRESYIII